MVRKHSECDATQSARQRITERVIPCARCAKEGRENTMSEVRVKENESLESALRRFKRQCARAGVIQEVRKRGGL